MKKLLLISLFAFVALAVSAQRGRTKTLAVDTLKGNNNQTLGTITNTGDYSSLYISCKIERISTAAGGTLYLKAGVDSASTLVENQVTNANLGFAPNDTLTTTDVATQYWNITIPYPAPKTIHIFGDGDANDTIKITTSYIYR